VRVWIDVDNPPQAQYLLPLKPAFEAAGCSVDVTTREFGMTLALVRSHGVEPWVVGGDARGSKIAKVAGVLRRAHALTRAFPRDARPRLVVTGSRAGALAGRWMRIPPFLFCDYEFVDMRVARASRAYVLFPTVIDPAVLHARGIARDRLIPFDGLKEDLSFAGIDVDAIAPHELPGIDESRLRVLFRPPAEYAHYHAQRSSELAAAVLGELAGRGDIVVVYAPRHPGQLRYLDGPTWANPPIVLDRPAHFVALLKAVDAVVSSGGTMLREAAYLGVPAFSILGSPIGSVDRHLERLGRLRIVGAPGEIDPLDRRRGAVDPLRSAPALPETLARSVLAMIDA
jgi:predicted glycosyltransferase